MSENIVGLHNIRYVYPSGTVSLDNVSLTIPRGKKIALLGGNGAGKSTLMLMLNGILKPTTGYLSYNGEKYRYNRKYLKELRRNVGLIFHNSDHQLIAPTVFEEISFGLNNLYKSTEEILTQVKKIMDEFCLARIEDYPPHNLSDGQKKRICLAAVMAMGPELVVCDEPASNLDPYHANLTFNYLTYLNTKGKTILYSTHDVNQAYTWANLIIVLKEGKVLCTGSPKEVFSNKQILNKAGLYYPFIVESTLALKPDIASDELPGTMEEFRKLLKPVVC